MGEVDHGLDVASDSLHRVAQERHTVEPTPWTDVRPTEPGLYVGFSTARVGARVGGTEEPSIYSFDGVNFQHWTGWYDHAVDRWIKLDQRLSSGPEEDLGADGGETAKRREDQKDLSSDLRASLLLEALRPFAVEADEWPRELADDYRPFLISSLMLGHFRRARTAIQQVEGK